MGANMMTPRELRAERERRAGCEALRYTRARFGHPRRLVGLYRSMESGMECDPELPWTTVCEDHRTDGDCVVRGQPITSHRTRQIAERALPWPESWCDACFAALKEDPPTSVE